VFSNGVSGESHPSTPSNKAFIRAPLPRTNWRRWLAGIPLIGVALFTLNGPAPAQIVSDAPPPAPVQPAAHWSSADLKTLIALAEQSAAEGLNPGAYPLAALRTAANSGQTGPEVDQLANSAALSLAHDYADGRIDDKRALDWYMDPPTDPNALSAALEQALANGDLAHWLVGLLPDNPQYAALKKAYAATALGDSAARDRLRANLERWRWMPRNLGDLYILVNVPAFRLQLMSGGVEQASYKVVVGAPKTPTPQLSVEAQSIIANPSWILPPAVLKEGGWQHHGYRVRRLADGTLMVRQAPGPRNALGRLKIDMPNPLSIYLHDTPDKAAFRRENRALSHGCIRVQNIQELAAQIGEGADLDDALADPRTTRTLQLEKSVPVYIAYFTAEADPDGNVRMLQDPYGRDQALLAQLDGPRMSAAQIAAN
jgi:murein L,D-transpeptidase YcbB/YkuD